MFCSLVEKYIILQDTELPEQVDRRPFVIDPKRLLSINLSSILVGFDFFKKKASKQITLGIKKIQKEFPQMPLKTVDERYTSKMAKDAMLEMGMKKKDRRDKKLVDEIAATIMLQEYMQSLNY